jgi:hypothetical protein
MDSARYEATQKRYTKELNRAVPTQVPADFTQTLGTVDTLLPKFTNNFNPAQFTSLFAKDSRAYANDKACRDLPAPDMGMRDPAARTGCGWWYVPNSAKSSTAAYGTRRGPMSPNLDAIYGTGEWLWDPREAMQKESTKSSSKLKQCSDIQLSPIPNMGWCTSTNRAVLTDGKGNPAFPNDPRSDCPGGVIITSAANCNPAPSNACSNLGVPSPDYSIRLYTQDECNTLGGNFYANGECIKKGGGSWSWDCRTLNGPAPTAATGGSISVPHTTEGFTTCTDGSLSSSCIRSAVTQQCNDSGTLSQALMSGYAGSSSTFNDMYAVLQERNFSIPSGIINDGKLSMADAVSAVSKIKTWTNDSDPRISGAARNLCLGNPFDSCSFPDSAAKPFSASCISRAALAAGWSPNGTAIPTKDMSSWNSLATWGDVLKQISAWKTAADNFGPGQLDYIKKVYGITAKPPNHCPSVKVRQNCDNFSGWEQELPGQGTFYADSDFKNDASYIIVPAGGTALLTNGGGEIQRVDGPGEFNFCSRNGFNDNVKQIVVYSTLRPPAVPFDNYVTYRQYDRIIWNNKIYQLSQFIGAAGYSPDHPGSGYLWKAE